MEWLATYRVRQSIGQFRVLRIAPSEPPFAVRETTVAQIHPTAIVDPRAELGAGVVIGPFCVVEAGAVIGEGSRLECRVTVKTRTTLGKFNEISDGVVLGGRAQHVAVMDPGGTLVIGDGNRIRENCTVHRGFTNDAVTAIGNNNLLMVNVHVAHDCRLGNHTIIVNNAMLGGHVHIDDRAYVSGGVAVHQFCRVGRLAMIGGLAKVVQDVPPYVMIEGGGCAYVVGLNKVGLRRNGYTTDEIAELKQAYGIFYRQGNSWNEALAELKKRFPTGVAAIYHEFLKQGKRGFVQERRAFRQATLKLVRPEDDAGDERSREVA
jgi:UDP-N-acetylglucosamine acyltransferase